MKLSRSSPLSRERTSYDHAEEDILARQLLEARNEAETILVGTARALGANGSDEVSREERAAIENAVAALEEAVRGEDHTRIRDLNGALNEATKSLAERLMDNVVKAALRNKSVSEALKE